MIININGGLGNQFFQYAFARRVLQRRPQKLVLDTYFYRNHPNRQLELDSYQVEYDGKLECIGYNRIRRVVQRVPGVSFLCGIHKEQREFRFDFWTERLPYRYYTGYWQNIRYLEDNKEELRKWFTYNGTITEEQQALAYKMTKENSVAIHVRHGDYQDKQFCKTYCVQEEDYYQKAIKYINDINHGKIDSFYFFSDDIEWCKQKFNDMNKVTFIDKRISQSPHTDMWLMKKCKNIIMANSTFSWWAAWLNDNSKPNVVVPKNWYRDDKKNRRALDALVEKEWKIIE